MSICSRRCGDAVAPGFGGAAGPGSPRLPLVVGPHLTAAAVGCRGDRVDPPADDVEADSRIGAGGQSRQLASTGRRRLLPLGLAAFLFFSSGGGFLRHQHSEFGRSTILSSPTLDDFLSGAQAIAIAGVGSPGLPWSFSVMEPSAPGGRPDSTSSCDAADTETAASPASPGSTPRSQRPGRRSPSIAHRRPAIPGLLGGGATRNAAVRRSPPDMQRGRWRRRQRTGARTFDGWLSSPRSTSLAGRGRVRPRPSPGRHRYPAARIANTEAVEDIAAIGPVSKAPGD